MVSDVERIYAGSRGDPEFGALLKACRPENDESLAELIEADGRYRLRKGRTVDLDRYLTDVPDLRLHPDALDAAIDIALRGLSGSGRITPDAVERLVSRHPSLTEPIRETASLNAALWSTSGLKRRIVPPPVRELPCDFGPRLSSGQRRYLLEELLGQGSFGQVYKATDRQLSEEGGSGHRAIVAIKVLADTARTAVDRQRLIDEATKVRRISHPNVVQVLDRGVSEDDEDFIVYEHVDGGDLSDLREDQLPLNPREAAGLMAKIARGVHAAHSAGVIHCDLKPSNVMCSAAGEPKVADFGIAIRLDDRAAELAMHGSASRGPIGNIAFISPEQFRGEDVALSVPSDVYALGGILFHLLTGRLPNGSTRAEIAATHSAGNGREYAPSPAALTPQIDRDLDAICQRALAPRAADRYASAAALAEDLDRWLALEPVPFTRPSVARRLRLWARRSPALATASVAILLLTAAGVTVATHFASVANQRRVQVALAELEIRHRQADEAFRARVAAGMRAGLSIDDRGRFISDMLLMAWVLEYIYGPKTLDSPVHVNEVWDRRSQSIRTIIQEYRDAGRGDALETLLLEQMLAFWLVNQGDHAEAIPLLDHNLEVVSEHWPDDPWVSETRLIYTCAEVNRLRSATNGDAPSRLASAAALLQSLDAEAARLEVERPRSPLHYLVLNRVADLLDLLGKPDAAAATRKRLQALMDETQFRTAGITTGAAASQPARPKP